ncbi:MAG: acetoacetate decarboxylase family protein [Gemmatimonadota bacterium]|nr:acetoacetate decarboxylase family protein [Gemmatimonadota bacterium]
MNASDKNGFVQYHFKDAIGAFFELPTDNARALLPGDLQPIEPHHGSAVLSVMAFDFTDSMVGAYGELILSILVSPLIQAGQPMPRTAFYPFKLGTTTTESREHAIERWRLPHYMRNINLDWHRGDGHMTIRATDRGAPMVEMIVTEHEWSPVEHRYQSFMHDDDGFYTSTIIMQGQFSENEEERGGITIHSRGMTELLDQWDVTTTPFREMWMKNGVQTFQPLQQLAAYAKR